MCGVCHACLGIGCARVALKSRTGVRYIFCAAIRHGRSAPRTERAISFLFRRCALCAPYAPHVLSEDGAKPGAGAGIRFTPPRSFCQSLPLRFRNDPRTRKDHRFRCRHPPCIWPFSLSSSWRCPPQNHSTFQVYPSRMPFPCMGTLLQASPFSSLCASSWHLSPQWRLFWLLRLPSASKW